MRRSTFGVLCAVLFWCASCWGAESGVPAAEGSVPARAARIALGGDSPWSPLLGKAVYWFDATGTASIDSVEAGAESLPWRIRRREPHDRVMGGAVASNCIQ